MLPMPSGEGEHTSPLVVHSALDAQTWKPRSPHVLAHATSRPAVAPPSETVAQQIRGAGQVRALSHDTLKAGGAAPVMLASAGAVAPSSLGRELDSGRPASPGPRSPPTVDPPQPEASAAPNETAPIAVAIFMKPSISGGQRQHATGPTHAVGAAPHPLTMAARSPSIRSTRSRPENEMTTNDDALVGPAA